MNTYSYIKKLGIVFILSGAVLALRAFGKGTIEPIERKVGKVQKIRFVEDDAQNYMVSKVFELKNQKANDLIPFILGAVKRYATNSSVDRINYKRAKKQYIMVNCPVPLMPYIDDMIKKLDRPGEKGRNGSGIQGTGIIRRIYTPIHRSSERMMAIMIKAGIPSNAIEGRKQDAVVSFDKPTNRIFWKDSINKSENMYRYLGWLDRPVPQVNISLNVYEVRENDLIDVGIDYLAWKNGPGLNLLELGATFLEGSAIYSAFGPYGFALFAPPIDFSFIRILEQDGKARISSSSKLTISNGSNASLHFAPNYQNLSKNKDFASSVDSSSNDDLELTITDPFISLSGETDPKSGRLKYSKQDYAMQTGILNFSYNLKMNNVFERDNHWNLLIKKSTTKSRVVVKTGQERMLSKWVKKEEVEQTIGVPFLCELPVLKYIFGTTTKNKEKCYYFLTVKAELIHPDSDINEITGKLVAVNDLLKDKKPTKISVPRSDIEKLVEYKRVLGTKLILDDLKAIKGKKPIRMSPKKAVRDENQTYPGE